MSGINCDYGVFVTFLADGKEQTIPYYARDRELSDVLVNSLRRGKFLWKTHADGFTLQYEIVNVTTVAL